MIFLIFYFFSSLNSIGEKINLDEIFVRAISYYVAIQCNGKTWALPMWFCQNLTAIWQCDLTDISQIGQSTVKTYHECDLSGSEHTTWVRQAARVGPGLGFGPDLVSYAGFITARHPQFNSHLYFWFFPSQADPSNDPIILWLQVEQFRNTYPVLERKPTFFESRKKRFASNKNWKFDA